MPNFVRSVKPNTALLNSNPSLDENELFLGFEIYNQVVTIVLWRKALAVLLSLK